MRIRYNANNLRGLGDFILRPGVNDVPADVWRKFADTPVVRALIDDGTISRPMDAGEADDEVPVKRRGRKAKQKQAAPEATAGDDEGDDDEPNAAELAAAIAQAAAEEG